MLFDFNVEIYTENYFLTKRIIIYCIIQYKRSQSRRWTLYLNENPLSPFEEAFLFRYVLKEIY